MTMIRWQRAGWRLSWRWKCRAGRPRIPVELRALIRRMAQENPVWGEERIASELLVNLGVRISPRTVRKYMPKPPAGQPRGDQRWATFLTNPAKAILACDFFVAVTATFRLLYVFVVIEHSSRRLSRLPEDGHVCQYCKSPTSGISVAIRSSFCSCSRCEYLTNRRKCEYTLGSNY